MSVSLSFAQAQSNTLGRLRTREQVHGYCIHWQLQALRSSAWNSLRRGHLRRATSAIAATQPGQADQGSTPEYPDASGRAFRADRQPPSAGAELSKDARYKALFAIISGLSRPGSPPEQLERFLRARPEATAVPFIVWLADLEAAATGAAKQQLACLCEQLVMVREQLEAEGQEQLYKDTIKALAGGDSKVETLVAASPRDYSLALSEAMTGRAAVLEGYGDTYDLLLKLAPPAALTPEAIRKGHELAEELGKDMALRRKRSVAAVINSQQQLTQEQEDVLLAGSPSSRILDLLLDLATAAERVGLLPDCFTPPAGAGAARGPGGLGGAPGAAGGVRRDGEGPRGGHNTPGSSGRTTAAAAGESEVARSGEGPEETEELWCTPLQLLNEINSRLKAVAGAADDEGAGGAGAQRRGRVANAQAAMLQGGGSHMSGEAYVSALVELKDHIQSHWLEF